MTVKHYGVKYTVRFWPGLWYILLSFWLWIKKSWRRVEKIVEFLIPMFLLVPIWGAFIFLLCLQGKHNALYYLNECKYSVFSSVVIASIVRLQNKIPEQKKNIRDQYNLYSSLLQDADDFVEYIFRELVVNRKQKAEPLKHPLYTIERYRELDGVLSTSTMRKGHSRTEMPACVSMITDSIKELKKMNQDGRLNTESDVDYHLDCVYRRLKEFEEKCNIGQLTIPLIKSTIWDIFCLVDELRYPWRRDEKINKLRREIIICDNPNEEQRDYYLNLFEVIP